MLNKLLKKYENLSMKNGSFFSDKSYKYDTIFFVTKYLYELIDSNNEIDLSGGKGEEITKNIVKDFSLPASSDDANKNYLLEGLRFLCYIGALKKESSTKYTVLDFEQLDFITVSIENSYIIQYLVAYKTFVNDGIWNIYCDYHNSSDKTYKEQKLVELKSAMCKLSPSIGDETTVWASNMTKFPVMVLGLNNDEYKVSRTLNVQDEKIKPENLSANVEGTRSESTKNNFYLHSFRIGYVKKFLETVSGDKKMSTVNYKAKTKGGLNKIYYGAPGCGKSFIVKKMLNDAHIIDDNRIRVTFHPEYSNTDFIGQILPTIEEISNADGTKKEVVKYIFNPGPFTLALKRALEINDMVYLVIEEINRGNAAAIFGDLFQLLDRVNDKASDKIDQSEYPICNVNIQKYIKDTLGLDEYSEIIIPSNLTILATMNSSDQNVFTLDTAFKRRWTFEQISNDIVKDTTHSYKNWYVPGTDVTWSTFLVKLNDKILDYKIHNQTNEDKRLGKYFVTKDCLTEKVEKIADVKETAENFAYKVLEYIWNDVCKIGREEWFDTLTYKTLEDLIAAFIEPDEASGKTPLSVFLNISF